MDTRLRLRKFPGRSPICRLGCQFRPRRRLSFVSEENHAWTNRLTGIAHPQRRTVQHDGRNVDVDCSHALDEEYGNPGRFRSQGGRARLGDICNPLVRPIS